MRRDTMQYYSYPLLSVQWIRYICQKLQLHAGSGGLFTAVLPDSYTVIILSLSTSNSNMHLALSGFANLKL